MVKLLRVLLRFLKPQNSIYFVRAANDSTATDASASLSVGSCPAFIVSGPATTGNARNCFGGTGGTAKRTNA